MLGDVDGCVEQVGGRMGGVKSRTRSIPGMGVMNNLLRVDPEKRLSPSPTDLLQQQTMTFPLFLGGCQIEIVKYSSGSDVVYQKIC